MAPHDPISIERHWLAATMAGITRPSIADGDGQADALLACAIEEGVVALVHRRLTDDPTIRPSLLSLFATGARGSAATSLLQEAECRRVLTVLQEAQIPVLLLKGSALAWWLYSDAYLRECADIDLLFSSRPQAEEAVRLLAAHGYTLNHKPGDLSYESMCRREVGSTHVDLDIHWRLVNSPLFADLLGFEALLTASIPLPRLARDARGLGLVHALLHACIHRAVNLQLGIPDRLKWLYDLHLLVRLSKPPDWSTLQLQCRELGLSGICIAGIETAASLFGHAAPEDGLLPLRDAATHELLDASRLHDWKYMQRRNLAALPSLQLRLRWLWQRLFPPIGYLRELYGADLGIISLWLQRALHAFRRFR